MATPLTPDETAHALAVYRDTGTFAAAALAVGRDRSTVRKALRRHVAPERHELMAAELEVAHANALRSVAKARRKAAELLDVADDPRDVALLAHTLNDALRATTTARAAHARLVTAAPSHEAVNGRVIVQSDDELEQRITRLLDAHTLDVPSDPCEAEREALEALRTVLPRALEGDELARQVLGALIAAGRGHAPRITGMAATLAIEARRPSEAFTVYLPPLEGDG